MINLKFFLLQVVILVVIGIIFWKRNQVIAYIKKAPFPRLNKYFHSFGFMVMSRLLISSGVPIILFYIASYNYEQNLYARFEQIAEAANTLEVAEVTSISSANAPKGARIRKMVMAPPGR